MIITRKDTKRTLKCPRSKNSRKQLPPLSLGKRKMSELLNLRNLEEDPCRAGTRGSEEGSLHGWCLWAPRKNMGPRSLRNGLCRLGSQQDGKCDEMGSVRTGRINCMLDPAVEMIRKNCFGVKKYYLGDSTGSWEEEYPFFLFMPCCLPLLPLTGGAYHGAIWPSQNIFTVPAQAASQSWV